MRLFRKRKKHKRVLILGLDCASPDLIFRDFRDDLPTLKALMQGGMWGELTSCIPCITVPAWTGMFSGLDPGTLGIYGFRNRRNYSYASPILADSRCVAAKRLWDYAGESGRNSVVIGVPQTFPVAPLQGFLVSGFLTPGRNAAFAYPAIFKQEVLKVCPHYDFDIENFRACDKELLLQRIFDFTDMQYTLLEYALRAKQWDLAIHVNIALDRVHHSYWRYFDQEHRFYEPDHDRFGSAIRDYYKMIDSRIGRVLQLVADDVAVLIVSDHGVKRMDGAICVNEWLWRNQWLVFKSPVPREKITPFEELEVDWSRTRAWSTGGYYGRIFLNVAGREPQGVIPVERYNETRNELAEMLRGIPDADGYALATEVFKPDEIYHTVNGFAPDLLVYFGDLRWRTVGGLGYETCYALENDTGPDDANHAQQGMFILYDPQRPGRGEVRGAHLLDIAPAALNILGIRAPVEMRGRALEQLL